jgi:alkanesulfonate monooxygenase SsuD/methylene tetrahydromethanopterin reductase-like flavin-dependent oxidoreductase (luciferase family)
LLAKIAETVDEISSGRLILGLGAGWHEPEFTTYGFPFDHRASRFEEAFTIICDLIRTGQTKFSGVYERAPDCEMRPRGPRNGRIPIMVGTDGPRLLRLAARHADLWNTTWTRSVEEILPRLEALDWACEAEGRDPDSIGRSACVHLDLPGAVGVWSPEGTTTPQPRSTDASAELLKSYADQGIGHVMIWLDPYTPAAVDGLGEAVQLLRR